MRAAAFIAAFLVVMLALLVGLGWRRDNAVLRTHALEVTRGIKTTSEAIVALNHWVYGHQGFAKNKNYYLVKALGPTPLQIMRSGGDCSDKSRLLSAMLYQLGVPSGLVMIYPCAACRPIHTVIEAEYEKGRMVVDPIWNLDYPAGGGKYYGIHELAGTVFGRQEVLRLKAQNSGTAKIAAMPLSEATFDFAKAINWNKNPLMRATAALLRAIHVDPSYVRRPRILEDPKLAITVLLGGFSAALFLFGVAMLFVSAKLSKRPLTIANRLNAAHS